MRGLLTNLLFTIRKIMLPPILFVDDKVDVNSNEYRYKKLERILSSYSNLVEFIGDLELNYSINEYTGEVDYIANPNLNVRKIVFIHASLDMPRYPEIVINEAKLVHQDTMFIKFSGERVPNLRKENLIFSRKEHIYNFETNGFELFIKFYSETKKPEYYFLKYGKDAFDVKSEEVNRAYNRIKSNKKIKEQLDSKKLDGNFEDIMRLANIYEDKERYERGIKYILSLESVSEYFKTLDKYVRLIKESILEDREKLINIL